VLPLCEFLLPLYAQEKAKSWRKKAETAIRGSFKSFLGLMQSTSNQIVDQLSGFDFVKRSKLIQTIPPEKMGKLIN